MRILVTGVAGFIGSHLAERLSRQGHTVRGVDCLTAYYDRSQKWANVRRVRAAGVDVCFADLAEDSLADLVDGMEMVYHLAAQPGLSAELPRQTYVRNNVRATECLLTALEDHSNVKGVVFASSSSVYGAEATAAEDEPLAPVSIYGQTKYRAEQLVRAAAEDAGWGFCILRLFSVYGPRERPDKLFHKAIRCVQSGEAFPLYDGSEKHRRSFTYVGDAVDGLVAVLNRFSRCAGETVNLGNPESVSTRRALDLVEAVAGQPLRIDRAPRRPGDQYETRADMEKAQRLLECVPATTLREGIAAELAWMQEAVLKQN